MKPTEHREKISLSKMGSLNPQWKGDDVGLTGLHKWVEKRLGRPDTCVDCGEKGKVDLANISQQYKRDLSDWEWLCRSCHMKKDGRLENFKRNHFNYPKSIIICKRCSEEKKHKARGLCRRCYLYEFRKNTLNNYDRVGHIAFFI